MIVNIIDNRTRPYRWKSITAIVEAAFHDNSVADSDQTESQGGDIDVDYDSLEGVSLAEAVAWAQSFEGNVTLFLYDLGDGTNSVPLVP